MIPRNIVPVALQFGDSAWHSISTENFSIKKVPVPGAYLVYVPCCLARDDIAPHCLSGYC
ncbi:hypothetical protein P029_04430 [Anaplasma phagocytophilum str. Norway variant2]|uniref:Uncharacterized protein n=1 Tax=Anaplasma phagocytophilum str. Norway variant2 TaxID=1392507 RepID=A0A168HGU9_ANAPH|nr:hypothetical protein P029_04430 [Anaplasma phagocytophilum str. Norway variant2]